MPDPNSVIIARPNFDTATSFVSYFFSEVVIKAMVLGYNVTDLEGGRATRINFESAISYEDPELVFAGGHGCENVFTLDRYDPVLWIKPGCPDLPRANDNVESVRNRIVYLLSCRCGARLGQKMPVKAFIGYNKDYIITGFHPGDIYSQGHMEACNIIPITLLNGGTISEAINNAKAKYDEWIQYWENSLDPLAPVVVTYLLHDRSALVSGEPTALGFLWMLALIPFIVKKWE